MLTHVSSTGSEWQMGIRASIPFTAGRHRTTGHLKPGWLCVFESYVGAVGERDGVKLEPQVLAVEDGYEILSTYPFEERLLDRLQRCYSQ